MTSTDDAKVSGNRFWRHCKLGDRVEHLSPQQAWGARDSRRRWQNWRWFIQLCREDRSFLDELSTPQRRAATILLDWDNGTYQTGEERRFSATFLKGNDSGGNESIANSLLRARAGSEYQINMVKLFMHEFDMDSWDNQQPNKLLHFQLSWSYRQSASQHAAAQQLAFSVLCDNAPSLHIGLQSPSLRGPSLQTCEWLADKYPKLEDPKFLWNIQNGETVCVKTLPQCPRYTCISHTWGRLRMKADPVRIKGVPWCVPQVEPYKVQDLPELFKRLEWKTSHLWIDLFCIPQDPEWADITNIEIRRQTHIFGGCQECVVWLNDIEGTWNVVQRALRWLGAAYFSASGREDARSLAATVFAELRNLPKDNIEILTSPAEKNAIKKYALWFSSTWTVQEAFLCPQMVLVNKHWQPLTATNGHLIPLRTVINLLTIVKPSVWEADMVRQYNSFALLIIL